MWALWGAAGQFSGRSKKFACMSGALRELTRMQRNEPLWRPASRGKLWSNWLKRVGLRPKLTIKGFRL